ncbi:MAG: response regulator [Desulfobacula sp.]|nr:response regulator [Desulfobacula sp.]
MDDYQKNYTILLVDDEAGIRNVLKITLAHSGFNVLLAPDGDSGLQIFMKEKPQIVITDIKMPGINGIEVLKRIKDLNPETEVIMITGHGDMDLAVQSLQYEAADFITKPIDSDALELSVQKAMDRISINKKIKNYMKDLKDLIAEKDRKIDESKRLVTIGHTIAGMSHVIKNIAGGLKGSSFILEQGIAHENREYLVKGWEMMKGNIDKITNLSLDLLNYAKTSRLNTKDIDPNIPAIEINALLAHRAIENDIDFHVSLTPSDDPISIDKDAINNALFNLVTNAFDSFTTAEPDSVNKKVSLIVKSEKETITYIVQDNGCGMRPSVRQAIFQNFITTKGTNGTGFGLMTTKKIIDEHNGSIGFKTSEDLGSEFIITLPKKT